jgi:hypothetical protein
MDHRKNLQARFTYNGALWENPYVDQAKDLRMIFTMEILVRREKSTGQVLHTVIRMRISFMRHVES